jgi:hypothetical protein
LQKGTIFQENWAHVSHVKIGGRRLSAPSKLH